MVAHERPESHVSQKGDCYQLKTFSKTSPLFKISVEEKNTWVLSTPDLRSPTIRNISPKTTIELTIKNPWYWTKNQFSSELNKIKSFLQKRTKNQVLVCFYKTWFIFSSKILIPSVLVPGSILISSYNIFFFFEIYFDSRVAFRLRVRRVALGFMVIDLPELLIKSWMGLRTRSASL